MAAASNSQYLSDLPDRPADHSALFLSNGPQAAPVAGASSSSIAPVDRLSQLPGELIENICENLFPMDIRNFRLSCKALKEKSYHQFGVCFFGVSKFMITRESLQTLIHISKNKTFGPCIKELQMCLVTFPQRRLDRITGYSSRFHEEEEEEHYIPYAERQRLKDLVESNYDEYQRQIRNVKRERRRAYGKHMHAQHTLRKQSIDVTMLAEALRNLPSLESITINCRFDRSSLPWGCRKIRREIGMWPAPAFTANKWPPRPWLQFHDSVRQHNLEYCTHGLAVALGAILKSGIKLKGALNVDGAPYTFVLPQKPDSRKVDKTPAKTLAHSQINDLKLAFADLKRLSIKAFEYQRNDHPLPGHEEPLNWLSTFAPLWPAVQDLSITGAGHPGETYIVKTLAKLGDHFPRLRRLKLSKTHFHVPDLITVFLSHINTLQHFGASKCTVSDRSHIKILAAFREYPAMVSVELVNNPTGPYSTRPFEWLTFDSDGVMVKKTAELSIKAATPQDFQHLLGNTLALYSL